MEPLAVIRGGIGDPSNAREIASTAIKTFGSIDGVVNNAGVFFTKPFTDYTAQDFEKLSGTNLRGYINITQLAVKHAKEGVRFNAVAPRVVDTPMHASDSKQFLKSLSPMGEISDIADIVDPIVYLTEARHVTGEVLRVDAGAHKREVAARAGS